MRHHHAFSKVCRNCRVEKGHAEYRVSRDYADGLDQTCRACLEDKASHAEVAGVCRTCRGDKRRFRWVRHAWHRVRQLVTRGK